MTTADLPWFHMSQPEVEHGIASFCRSGTGSPFLSSALYLSICFDWIHLHKPDGDNWGMRRNRGSICTMLWIKNKAEKR